MEPIAEISLMKTGLTGLKVQVRAADWPSLWSSAQSYWALSPEIPVFFVKAVVCLVGQKTWLYGPMSQSTGLFLLAVSMLERRAKPAERQRKWRLLEKLIDATQTGAQPSCWELLEVCEGLWCITLVLVCCSAPAEGRTIRLWSAWCRSSWGFGDQYFSCCSSLSHCVHPSALAGLALGYLRHLYGLTRPKQSMDQAYPRCSLPPSPSLLCVSLGIKLLLSGKVSLVLNYPSSGVCNITNCHTGFTNVLEHIISDTPDKFRSASTRAENCILLVKYQSLWHGWGFFWSHFVEFVSLWHYYWVCSSVVWTVLYSKSSRLHKLINCFYSLNCTFSIA